MAAYLEFILLTGARRSEAAQLKWTNVNDGARVLTFTDTKKNGEDRTIPITSRVREILDDMKRLRMGDYVFASVDKDGNETHVSEPRKALQRDVLPRFGWVQVSSSEQVTYWRRPGKDDGISATEFHDSDLLHCHTTSTALEAGRTYSKFGALAVLAFGGDKSACAVWLAKHGYNKRSALGRWVTCE